MDEKNSVPRPNYLPALAFVGVLIGVQNLAIQSDTTPDPFLRPALSVTQAFRLPPEMQPAKPRTATVMASLMETAELDPEYQADAGYAPEGGSPEFREAELGFSDWEEPPEVAPAEPTEAPGFEAAPAPAAAAAPPARVLPAPAAPPAPPVAPAPPPAPEADPVEDLVAAAIRSSQSRRPAAAPAAPPAAKSAPTRPEAVLRRVRESVPRMGRAKPKTVREYVVHAGDTLYGIARKFELSVPQVLARNPRLTDIHSLHPGMRLRIGTAESLEHQVVSGESLWGISRLYGLEVGQIIAANGLGAPSIFVGQKLKIPTASMSTEQLAKAVRRKRDRGAGFLTPVFGRTTDHFGMRRHPILRRMIPHRGLDIAAREGTAIRATQSGVVSFSGTLKGYGKLIEIRHKNGITSRYGHCSALLKRKGQRVEKGDSIARVGSTGLATAAHLHFEIRRKGVPMDPLKFL